MVKRVGTTLGAKRGGMTQQKATGWDQTWATAVTSIASVQGAALPGELAGCPVTDIFTILHAFSLSSGC